MFTRNSPRWNAKKYPANWAELSLACRVKACWHCEQCGIAHRASRISKKGNAYTVYLSACHVYRNDESNPNPVLICLCVSCHGKYDTRYKSAMARARIQIQKHRKAQAEKQARKELQPV